MPQQVAADHPNRTEELEASTAELARLREEIAQLQADLGIARQLNARVEGSVTWQLLLRIRNLVYAAIGGEGSRLARALQRSLRGVGRLLIAERQANGVEHTPYEPSIDFPHFEEPGVSVIVTVFAQAELTRACLESIRDRKPSASYEVIIVNDGADAATTSVLAAVRGARMLVNTENIGYLRSVNRAASQARGRWLVLCNNDIQVHDGWLDAMLSCGESSGDVVVVSPRYVYPDGSLQEAGSLIWRDGTGNNYGRGANAEDWRYQFRREVDYGSAAALLVRANFWREIGGFDERFAPMYYEDADLCFQARERGFRVMYEPRATVVHAEGSTAGTDLTTGYKRHQELNRSRFVEKWRHRLESEHWPPDPRNVERAARRNSGPPVLIIDEHVPRWDRDAGSLRMLAMIKGLIELGCRVTLFPSNLGRESPYAEQLGDMGVEVWCGPGVDVPAEFSAAGPGLALAITCRQYPSSRWLEMIRQFAPSTPVVFDTVDLHWLREARRAALEDGSDHRDLGPRAVALREIELALVRATDATLVVSPDEKRQVEADVPGAVVRVLPTINEVRSEVPPCDGRAGVLLVANFEHPPNVDCAVRLVHRVMPLVWDELGPVRVTLVGAGPPPSRSAPHEVEVLASPLVRVTGWVQDVEPLLDAARAVVAPISYGAGVRGKITHALASGLPVVTTPIGAEGLGALDGEHMLIAEGDAELADRTVRLLTDDELWTSLSRAGRTLAGERYSPSVARECLAELMKDLAHVDVAPQDPGTLATV